MKTITKETLIGIMDLQKLAEKRAHEFLMVHFKYPLYCDGFRFYDDGITVSFREDTDRECKEHPSTTIHLEQLQMSDAKWSEYIQDEIEVKENMPNIVREMRRRQQQNTNNRFLVVWEEEDKTHRFMETAWTNEGLEILCKWKVISEHPTKEDARIQCEKLNEKKY